MAAAVRPPRRGYGEPVPAGLRREDVLRLLATTEGDRPVDKRDRAILMLFVAYGLRASEVTGLQLDDLDWENETLHVRLPSRAGRISIPCLEATGRPLFATSSRLGGNRNALFSSRSGPIPAGESRGIEEHCCTAFGPPRSHNLAPRAARTAACGCPASSRSGHVIQGNRGLSRAPRPVVHRRLRQGQPQCAPGSHRTLIWRVWHDAPRRNRSIHRVATGSCTEFRAQMYLLKLFLKSATGRSTATPSPPHRFAPFLQVKAP